MDVQPSKRIDKEILRRVQFKELELLSAVHQLCIKHGIQYFMIHGTLLGAVKYKGFIAWDDDIDIGMMRKDFQIFEHYANELPKNMFLQTPKTDPQTPTQVAKLRLNGTKFITDSTDESKNYHKGIPIDIFVFDYYPGWTKVVECALNFVPDLKQKRKRWHKGSWQRVIFGVLIAPLYWIHSFFQKIWVKCVTPLFRGNANCDFIGQESILNNGEYWEKQDIFPLINLQFENQVFMAPNAHMKYLQKHYGVNFMTYTPSDNEQHWHAKEIIL
ncbi:MAG: LicD family protein [Phascolarctobacterium sp.]|nr:LicD family protein [Candidatus Phascolarctobacterium caballi]